MSSFMENLQKALSQGFDASKEFLEKAGAKAKELGEKGVIKLEILQLNSQMEKVCAKIGAQIYIEAQENNSRNISLDDEDIKPLFDELNKLKVAIAAKEEALKKAGEDKQEKPSEKAQEKEKS